MLKRFRFGSQDSITNPNPNIIRLAKITNPNPNIRDSEKKIRIRIRIRIFVTTLIGWLAEAHLQPILSQLNLQCFIYIYLRCIWTWIDLGQVWKVCSGQDRDVVDHNSCYKCAQEKLRYFCLIYLANWIIATRVTIRK